MNRCTEPGVPLSRRLAPVRPLLSGAVAALAALTRGATPLALGTVLGAAVGLGAFAPSAHAQGEAGHRVFPAQALRGELVVSAAPEVVLNGKADRLAPGARIRGVNNLLQTPASLTGQRVVVHYTREATTGLLLDVWVLNGVELARRPWPTTEREAQTWTFDPAAQTWKRP
jgi:hypothetical protein